MRTWPQEVAVGGCGKCDVARTEDGRQADFGMWMIQPCSEEGSIILRCCADFRHGGCKERAGFADSQPFLL